MELVLILEISSCLLYKGRSHKYVKREPYTDTKGKRRYRYYYKLPQAGIVSSSSLVVGSSFAYGQGDQKGHYHIKDVQGTGDDKQVTIEHDETGEKRTVKVSVLRSLLQGSSAQAETKEKVGQKLTKLINTTIQAAKTGSKKQIQARLNDLSKYARSYEKKQDVQAFSSEIAASLKDRGFSLDDFEQDLFEKPTDSVESPSPKKPKKSKKKQKQPTEADVEQIKSQALEAFGEEGVKAIGGYVDKARELLEKAKDLNEEDKQYLEHQTHSLVGLIRHHANTAQFVASRSAESGSLRESDLQTLRQVGKQAADAKKEMDRLSKLSSSDLTSERKKQDQKEKQERQRRNYGNV